MDEKDIVEYDPEAETCGNSKSSSGPLRTLSGDLVSTNELETTISQIMEKADVTGLSCAIINDSRVVYQNAFGLKDKNAGTMNDEETIFSAASFSKTVFAYLVMLLVEEGIIDLDRSLHEYLSKPLHEYSEYQDLKGDDRYKQITARMILSHSTGFPNLRLLTDNKLIFMFSPGERYSYSGEGINLLQMVIEEVTGRRLEELSREKIFEPLIMTRSSYIWQKEYEDNFALPHDQLGRPLRFVEMLLMRGMQRRGGAGGSMLTTAGDYARFLAGILNAERKRKASMEEMLRPQISITSKSMFGPGAWEDTDENRAIDLSWGLGWGRFDSEHGKAFFHTGHGFGWQNYTVTYADKGIGIVLLSNSDNFESVAKEIVEYAIGDKHSPFDWLGYVPFNPAKERVPPPEPLAVELSPTILEVYVGMYELTPIPANWMIHIRLENDNLFCYSDDNIREQLFAESQTQFFMKSDSTRFTFNRNDTGIVTGLCLDIQGLELPMTKVK